MQEVENSLVDLNRINDTTEKDVTPYAWVILLVVFIAGVAAPLNQFKVPPLMPLLMSEFQIDLSQSGMLISIFAFTGLILALPASVIIKKLGTKISGIIALSSLVIGSTLGVFSQTLEALLWSRFIEGLGMGLMGVVGPTAIAMWFPAARRGLPMGIWAVWSSLGGLIMYNLGPKIAIETSWRGVWWFGSFFALVALILFVIFMKRPEAEQEWKSTEAVNNDTDQSLLTALANKDIWLLSFMFGCFVFVFIAFASFLPTFLAEERGYTLAAAAFIASLPTLINLVSGPASGWVSDHIGSRKLVYTIPFTIIGLLFLFPFYLEGWQIPAFLIVIGFFVGAIPAAVFSAIPDVMRKGQSPSLGMAVLIIGQNLGMFAGPIVFGSLVETVGWVAGGYLLVAVCFLGVLAGLFVKVP